MRKSVTLTIAGATLALGTPPAPAAPLSVSTGTATTAPSDDGCPPGTHRDSIAVEYAKATYVDSTQLAKAIAGIPCASATSSGAISSVDSTGVTKATVKTPTAIAPTAVQAGKPK